MIFLFSSMPFAIKLGDCAKIWNFSHSPNAPAAMVPAMHAECACCRGTCYTCTPNAPAAVVPAMHAECACCRGTCYARRMRLLRALLNREPIPTHCLSNVSAIQWRKRLLPFSCSLFHPLLFYHLPTQVQQLSCSM